MTRPEIENLIKESEWQIEAFERPSAHNSILMIKAIKHLLELNNQEFDISEYEKIKSTSQWMRSRSEGDREQDRHSYFDYVSGMEAAIRKFNEIQDNN